MGRMLRVLVRALAAGASIFVYLLLIFISTLILCFCCGVYVSSIDFSTAASTKCDRNTFFLARSSAVIWCSQNIANRLELGG